MALDDDKPHCDAGATSISLWACTSRSRGLDVSTIKSKTVFVTFDEDERATAVEISADNRRGPGEEV